MKQAITLILLFFACPVMADTIKITDATPTEIASFKSNCIKTGGKLRYEHGWTCTPKS